MDTETRYCYSHDEEVFYGNEPSRECALNCAKDDWSDEAVLYTAEIVPRTAAYFVSHYAIEGLSEALGEAASEDGEHADDWPSLNSEQKKELQTLVADFYQKHCPPTFYGVKNVERHDNPQPEE